jgi:hypothetical protein
MKRPGLLKQHGVVNIFQRTECASLRYSCSPAELEISRPPLREAFRTLETEGLIVTRPRRGSFVTTLTDKDVYELLTLR